MDRNARARSSERCRPSHGARHASPSSRERARRTAHRRSERCARECQARLARRFGIQRGEARHGRSGEQQQFERPHRPERNDRQPVGIRQNLSRSVRFADSGVGKQCGPGVFKVVPLCFILPRRQSRHVRARPDLPVRMRVRRPHIRAAILENLNMGPARAKRGVLHAPCVDLLHAALRRSTRRETGRAAANNR